MPPILVRPRPIARTQAVVNCGGRIRFAAIGRAGLAALKREGDGATPRGRFRPLALLVRAPLRGPRASLLPHRTITVRDGWSDDVADMLYNRFRSLPTRFSHESLRRDDALYDVVIVTDHNQRPRIRGRGSAVFVHIARPSLAPTEGCIAFPRAQLVELVESGRLAGPLIVGGDPKPLSGRGRR